MKLFRTASVDTECQKLFSFLPLCYQDNIRTASFMLRFMATENYICNLFAICRGNIRRYYTRYSDCVDSINSLKHAILRQFTGI